MHSWQDPPHYWEQILHPTYVEAHLELFEGSDIENGKPTGQKAGNLVVMEGLDMEMSELVHDCCKIVTGVARQIVGSTA